MRLRLVPSVPDGADPPKRWRRTFRMWQAGRMREIDQELAELRVRRRMTPEVPEEVPDRCGECGQQGRLVAAGRMWLCLRCTAARAMARG